MAKPIECIIELNHEEAKVFLQDWLNPKPNPARDAALERARKLNIEIKAIECKNTMQIIHILKSFQKIFMGIS